MSKKPCKKCPKLDGAQVYFDPARSIEVEHPYDQAVIDFEGCSYEFEAVDGQPRTYILKRKTHEN